MSEEKVIIPNEELMPTVEIVMEEEVTEEPVPAGITLAKDKKAPPEDERKGLKYLIKDVLTVVIAAVIIAALLKTFVVDSRLVPSGSMEPTIMTDDRVIMLMFPYHFTDPVRGDVVVFTTPAQFDGNQDILKRVIGLPGETIAVQNGRVYIDGTALVEYYIAEPPIYTFAPTLIPEYHYFMLGDNRNRSQDSHSWSNPFVYRGDIRGRVVLRYWPLSSFGIVR